MGRSFLSPLPTEIALKYPIAEQSEDKKEAEKTRDSDAEEGNEIKFKGHGSPKISLDRPIKEIFRSNEFRHRCYRTGYRQEAEGRPIALGNILPRKAQSKKHLPFISIF